MFCSNCGAKNESAKFCAACGSPMQATAAPEPDSVQLPFEESATSTGPGVPAATASAKFATSLKNLSKKSKIFIFGGAGLVVLVVVGVIAAVALTPYEIDDSKAHRILMTVSEFDFDMEEAKTQTNISEVDGPLYNTSDACTADATAASQLDDARVMAFARYNNSGENFVYFKEDVIKFDSASDASEFIDTFKKGFSEDGCEYHSGDQWNSDNVNIGSAQDVVGAGGNAVAVEITNVVEMSSFSWDQRETIVAVQRGKYVFFIVGTVDVSESGVNDSEMKDAIKFAVEKI